MFGLTARKPNLGGKVFVPQKPTPKPVATPTTDDSNGSPIHQDKVQTIDSHNVDIEVAAPTTSGSGTPSLLSAPPPKIPILPGIKQPIRKVSFAPVSQKKGQLTNEEKISPTTTSSNNADKCSSNYVDTIMESAKVLQQLSSLQSVSDNPQNLDENVSDDDEAIAVHFAKPVKVKSTPKISYPEKAGSSKQRGPGQKRTHKPIDMAHVTSMESPLSFTAISSVSSSRRSDGTHASVPPTLQQPSNGSMKTNMESITSNTTPSPTIKRPRTSKSPFESSTTRSPRCSAAKKAKTSLHIFPLSYGNPTQIERVISYVRINQEGVEGITFVNEDERPVVSEISPSFPNLAGIKVKDVVISVNNLDAKYSKFDQLMNALVCKTSSKSKDSLELTGIIEKNSTYESVACVVFARPRFCGH